MLISEHRRRSPAAATSASSSDEEAEPAMVIVPERSRRTTTLHNFTTFPYFDVTWGRRKHLRCVKDFDLDRHNQRYYLTSSSSPSEEKRRSPNDDCDGEGDGIESVREKLMLDHKTEADQMKALILKRNHNNNGENRPWNLRTRRAVCKSPNFNGGSGGGGDKKGNSQAEIKTPTSRGGAGGGCEVEVKPRVKFSVSLSKQEIEEDFLSILGNRPARRPKKRPKFVQKQIDVFFPGFWLSEVTPDMYKVNEIADPASKR